MGGVIEVKARRNVSKIDGSGALAAVVDGVGVIVIGGGVRKNSASMISEAKEICSAAGILAHWPSPQRNARPDPPCHHPRGTRTDPRRRIIRVDSASGSISRWATWRTPQKSIPALAPVAWQLGFALERRQSCPKTHLGKNHSTNAECCGT